MVARVQPEQFEQFVAVEDQLLALFVDHGLVLEHRLRASTDHAEIQIISAPDRESLDNYLRDPRRRALMPIFDAIDVDQQIWQVEVVALAE